MFNENKVKEFEPFFQNLIPFNKSGTVAAPVMKMAALKGRLIITALTFLAGLLAGFLVTYK